MIFPGNCRQFPLYANRTNANVDNQSLVPTSATTTRRKWRHWFEKWEIKHLKTKSPPPQNWGIPIGWGEGTNFYFLWDTQNNNNNYISLSPKQQRLLMTINHATMKMDSVEKGSKSWPTYRKKTLQQRSSLGNYNFCSNSRIFLCASGGIVWRLLYLRMGLSFPPASVWGHL